MKNCPWTSSNPWNAAPPALPLSDPIPIDLFAFNHNEFTIKAEPQQETVMVLLFLLKIIISSIFAFALFATVLYREDFLNVSTGPGRGRRRILRVWGLGREPQQAWKAGAQRKVFANGAPYALLAKFTFRKKFSQFVRQNAPVYHITLIEGFFKNSSLKYETKSAPMSY